MKSKLCSVALALLISFCSATLFAQTEQEKLTATILHLDSLFWKAYNSCDTPKFKEFVTNDVEFYHDKGGSTIGLEPLVKAMNKNLCGNSDFRLRREEVEGTVKVYPLQNGNEIYGAIISGEHVFYVNEKGKEEFLDGQALFTHVWLLKDGEWKMARILSFNHHPAEKVNKRTEIELDENKLNEVTGTYKGTQSDDIIIKREENHLLMLIGNNRFVLYPESETMFFTKDRDLTFEFVKTADNKVTKMIVREKGSIAEEAVFEQ